MLGVVATIAVVIIIISRSVSVVLSVLYKQNRLIERIGAFPKS
jgi:hypothetical protein